MIAEYFANLDVAQLLYSIIRISTPLIYVALAVNVTLQAGLLNMAAESMMLASSLAGVLISGYSQSLFLGLLGGAAVSVLVTLFLCFATFVMKVDLYLMSISMNMALMGGTVYVMYLFTGLKSLTASKVPSLSVPQVHIPFIKDIPFLGKIISGHNGFTYLAFIMIFLVWFLIFKTKFGLRMRATGQNPQAVETVGINPRKIYTISFAISGFIASLGGMFLSMGYQNYFVREITAGRGFIGMAASNIALGQPLLSALVAIVFGAAEAVTQTLKLYIVDQQLLSSIPYIVTIVLIFVFSFFQLRARDRIERENRKRLEQLHEEEAAA
ncbi:MAG: ABC transporter permease [Ruminococcaceae bacterium]|nr:ABC transporter permease [Oscillospiraceae bacterium]